MNRAVRLALCVALCSACSSGRPTLDPPKQAAVARFDPAARIVPTPTDLVRDPVTGKMSLPIDDTLAPVDRDLRAYVNTLDGYPLESEPEVLFGALADPSISVQLLPESVGAESVRVLDVTVDAVPVEAERDLSTPGKLVIRAVNGWKPGRTYLIAVKGGEGGVKTAEGHPVDAEAAFHFLRGRNDIREHATVLPGETLEEKQASAAALEQIRQSYQPHFEALEKLELPREQVAVLWSFTTLSRRAVARFDPAASVVPIPTDLARDADAGMLALPIDDALSAADQQFRRYLNTLDGYPSETVADVRFGWIESPARGAGIDAGSVSSASVVVLDITSPNAVVEVPVTRELLDDGARLSLRTDGGWLPSHTYLAAIKEGPGGLTTNDGRPVVAQTAFRLLRGTLPITEYAPYFPGATPEEQRASAEKLEQVRRDFQPHFALLEGRGIARASLAVMWTFTIASKREHVLNDPLAAQAGDARQLPFPNDILRRTGKVELPIQPGDNEDVKKIKLGLTGIDGFSTSGALSFVTSQPVNASTLNAQSVMLLDLSGTTPVEVTLLERRIGPDPATVVLDPIDPAIKAANATSTDKKDPRAPLKPATTYAVVVTSDLKGAGNTTFKPTNFTEVMKLGAPVYVDGKSTLAALSDERAEWIEPLRATAQKALQWLESKGTSRDKVTLVYSFTTLATVPVLRQLNDLPYVKNVPLTITVEQSAPPGLYPGIAKPMPNTARIVTGKIYTYDRLDPKTRANRADGGGEMRQIPFTACVPLGLPANAKAPVAVFGQGLTTSKDLVYLICDDATYPSFSSIGMVAIAIDFPYHGARSACLSNDHCNAPDTCSPNTGGCVDAQGNPRPLKNAPISSTPWAQNIPQPAASGAAYVDIESLFATRDHVHQTLIDVSAQIRSIRKADWKTALGVELDPNDISYLGISLGGIVGSNMTAVDPRLGAAVLNVPGAGFVQLVQDSPRFRDEFWASLNGHGIQAGTAEFFRFENAARWIFDTCDPMNLTRHSRREPYVWIDPDTQLQRTSPQKKVLIQMATPDDVVPNTSTFLLERVLGVQMTRYFPTGKPGFGGHIFMFDPSEQPENARALNEAFTFLENR